MTAPVLAKTMPDGTRRYVHPVTGEIVPSVTTVLKVLHKPALDGWAAKVAAQYTNDNWDELSELEERDRINKIRNAPKEEAGKAAQLGTLIHEICEKFATGKAAEIPKVADPFVNQFLNFLTDVKPVFVENEVTVWSRKYGYAGTADAIAMIDEVMTVIDWKTGRGVYPEYGLQLAALSHAEFIIRPDGTEEEFPDWGRNAIVHLRPRSWKFIPLRETEECFAAFLACKRLHHWQNNVAADVLGEVRSE